MDFIKTVIEKAKNNPRKIVLPESSDERILKAASEIEKQSIAKIILVGNRDDLHSRAEGLGIDITGIEIIDPETSSHLDGFVSTYTERRSRKGMTEEKARQILTEQTMFFGAMLVDSGLADGMVAGAVNSTANTLRSIFHCVGTKEGVKTVSSFFVMVSQKTGFGMDGLLFFADCAVVPNPTDLQLSEIAEMTADNFKAFTDTEPKVAFLSFSTKGSAKTDETEEVVSACDLLKKKRPDITADGEFQLDAAIVESVAKRKAPGAALTGDANVLIFPDLNAGNIGYKLTQRFGDVEAIGPILQGARKPVNDLSRGCDAEDIVNVVAVTSVQAGMK
jgi:phosphate acetyltransferase